MTQTGNSFLPDNKFQLIQEAADQTKIFTVIPEKSFLKLKTWISSLFDFWLFEFDHSVLKQRLLLYDRRCEFLFDVCKPSFEGAEFQVGEEFADFLQVNFAHV